MGIAQDPIGLGVGLIEETLGLFPCLVELVLGRAQRHSGVDQAAGGLDALDPGGVRVGL
ncbi:hypothetical protein ACFQV2_12865 [Actinokineospora soli]|uniref:Uncharacterized protein n=1 Tax=Actinokineospora soli TaxID=1048753 RepID=A0ABW2TKK3_9PSEU